MIFIDRSFWVALVNNGDERHAEASQLLSIHGMVRLVTTTDVRGETWTFLRRRAGHRVAVRFLDSLAASPRVEVVRVTEAAEADALTWLRQRAEREYSWVDATSFATMRQRRMTEALAFDADFTAAGFVELRS